MKILKQSYTIKALPQKVWQSLTDPKIINKWGGGPAKMKPVKGFEFSLWGGDIFGKNIEISKNKKLTQEWYSGKWKQPSFVTFDLNEINNTTVVNLTHKNIPEDEFTDIEMGWKEYYMLPLIEFVENNL